MRNITLFFLIFPFMASANVLSLDDALRATYTACTGINDELTDLKKMAGINTAITSIGTVAGGVALGTGIAKAKIDAVADEVEAELQAEINRLNELAARQTYLDDIPDFTADFDSSKSNPATSSRSAESATHATASSTIEQKEAELEKLTAQSKKLGNIRTGTLAGATVADTAGAIIAAKNKVDKDLQTRIDECKLAVKDLQSSIMQARLNGQDITKAQQIINACIEYDYIDVSTINNRAKGAMVSSIIGATTGLAGTITSAAANRDNDTDSNKQKEKNLNSASNVFAGATTVASGVATVFNATQISTIKKVANVAQNCEEALK